MKTPGDIQNEINAIVDSWPRVDPQKLKVGDKFVIAGTSCVRFYGHKPDAGLCIVTKKTPTLFRFNQLSLPEQSLTFKGCARHHTLRRCTKADDEKVAALMKQFTAAQVRHQLNVKFSKDRYVVWNTVYEDRGGVPQVYREGFVLEAFDGNGKLLDRVRMLSESELSGEADGELDAVERMAVAYAEQFADECGVEQVFQIYKSEKID